MLQKTNLPSLIKCVCGFSVILWSLKKETGHIEDVSPLITSHPKVFLAFISVKNSEELSNSKIFYFGKSPFIWTKYVAMTINQGVIQIIKRKTKVQWGFFRKASSRQTGRLSRSDILCYSALLWCKAWWQLLRHSEYWKKNQLFKQNEIN